MNFPPRDLKAVKITDKKMRPPKQEWSHFIRERFLKKRFPNCGSPMHFFFKIIQKLHTETNLLQFSPLHFQGLRL